MCSQCSQRVKNDVKLVLSMLRFGYTFGYTFIFYSHFSSVEKLIRGLPLYESRYFMTIPTARHPPRLLLYSYSAMRKHTNTYSTPKKRRRP